MARKAQPKLVRFEDGVYWFVSKLAAEKTGLTKPELARRALAGQINHKTDKYGNPTWYAEPDIEPLRKENLDRKLEQAPQKKRPKTDKQLEREWAAAPKLNEIPLRMGPVAAHLEKLIFSDLNKKDTDKE